MQSTTSSGFFYSDHWVQILDKEEMNSIKKNTSWVNLPGLKAKIPQIIFIANEETLKRSTWRKFNLLLDCSFYVIVVQSNSHMINFIS